MKLTIIVYLKDNTDDDNQITDNNNNNQKELTIKDDSKLPQIGVTVSLLIALRLVIAKIKYGRYKDV